MLKKLYKHEFHSLFRSLVPIYIAVIGFALLSRIIWLFDVENKAISIIKGLSVTVYVFSIIAIFILSIVIVVTRFYKNLLSGEGYLTFTLPFTATQHIVCKLICGAVVTALSFIITLCSLLILGAGTDTLNSVFEAFGMVLDYIIESNALGTLVIFAIEIVIMAILTVFQGLLMYYAAIAIGQQFKNKVGGAVVSYIVLYAAVQAITTILVSPVAFINPEKFETFMNSGVEAVQIFLLFPILLSIVLSVAYFMITRHFLSKKLNLE